MSYRSAWPKQQPPAGAPSSRALGSCQSARLLWENVARGPPHACEGDAEVRSDRTGSGLFCRSQVGKLPRLVLCRGQRSEVSLARRAVWCPEGPALSPLPGVDGTSAGRGAGTAPPATAKVEHKIRGPSGNDAPVPWGPRALAWAAWVQKALSTSCTLDRWRFFRPISVVI